MHKLYPFALGLLGPLLAVPAGATTITLSTASGATTIGGPVNVSVTLTTSLNQIFVTITNNQANVTSAFQTVSGLAIALSTGQTVASIGSSSGQQISIDSSHNATLGSTGSTGWASANNFNFLGLAAFRICAVGCGLSGFTNEIIGPGPYTNANSTIAGQSITNPFLNQTATFTLNVAGVTSASQISAIEIQFGPGEFDTVIDIQGVPEPATYTMIGAGLVAASLLRRFRPAV